MPSSNDEFSGAGEFLRERGASPPKNAQSPVHSRPGPAKQNARTSESSAALSAGKSGSYEDRRNSAACFANPNRTESWHADFVGVMGVEG
jgi:hypothetical protein